MKKLNLTALMLTIYVVTFIAVVRLGIFSETVPPLRSIVVFWVVLLAASAVMLLLLVSAAMNRRRMRPEHWLGLISVVLIVTGIWTSRLADFAIDVALTEGQKYQTDAHRSLGLLYAGLISPVPGFSLFTESIDLQGGEQGIATGTRVRGRFQLSVPGGESRRPIVLSQDRPSVHHGMLFDVKSFGYSLRYVVRKSKRVIDSNFISMRIFPSGSEDYFRLLGPHTFYVRYYPGHREDGEDKPLRVRIARNKDILFNGYAALDERLEFEDATISFEEMRKWVEVSIGRPWGALLASCGLALLGVSGAIVVARTFRNRSSS